MNYPTCGEISCEECNDRYEKAMDRIAELEAMVREVRELVDKGPPGDYRREWRAALHKAFALLNQEERKP